MNNKRNIILAVTILLLASLACKSLAPSEPTSVPQETLSPEDSSPILPSDSSATEESSAQSGGAYDGEWTGTNTVDNKEILFTVENNQVVSIALNYTGESNDCDYHGAISTGVETGGIDPIEVGGEGFSAVVTSINDELTFTGTFTSDSEANGTLLIKSSADGLCGEYEKEVSWTATKGAVSEAEEEDSEDAASSPASGDVSTLVTSFFDAVNSGDVDSAIGFVDENIMFTVGTTITKFNSSELESYLQSTQGVTYEVSDVQSMAGGTLVQFKLKASDGATYSYCQAFVTDGKISMMSWMP